MDFILLTFAFSPSFLQPLREQTRSRSRKGDCQGPGNQHHRADHQVRSSSVETIILLLSSEVVDKNGFHFADLRIFSPVSCSLRYNNLGPEAGKEIAKALATNTTVQTIEYVRPLLNSSFYFYHPRWLIKMDFILLTCVFSVFFAVLTATTSVQKQERRLPRP